MKKYFFEILILAHFCLVAIPDRAFATDSIIFEEVDLRSQSPSCKFQGRVPGVCIDLSKCDALLKLLRSPSQDRLKILQKALCGYSLNSPMVCCPDVDDLDTLNELPPPPTSIRPPPALTSQPVIDLKQAPPTPPSSPVAVSPVEQQIQRPASLPETCGVAKLWSTRIVGGKQATKGTWPWMVGLVCEAEDGFEFFCCGGSLITNRHVLTAAHCTWEKINVKEVRLGTTFAPGPGFRTPTKTWVQSQIRRKIVHPGYIKRKLAKHDIAILELKESIQFTEYIQPICIPWMDSARNLDLQGMSAFSTGWGIDKKGGNNLSPELKEIKHPITDDAVCKEVYSKRKTSIVIDETVICSGDGLGNTDTCQGDSGGPVMLDIDGAFTLVGIISAGYKCSEVGFYGVNMKISHYVDWILQNI